jgi:hypothetical protein
MQPLFGQFARYASFAAWFFKDAFLRYRGRLAIIVAASASGIALQALAVLLAYQYAKAVESGAPLELMGVVLEPRASLGLLTSTAVAALVLAVASAVLVMYARVAGARLSLDYGDYCSQRIYAVVSRPFVSGGRDRLGDYTVQRLTELTRRDPVYCGIVLRSLIYSLPHVATVVVAGGALIVLDVYLSLTVFMFLAVAALFLRRISIQAASQRELLRRHSSDVAKEQRVLRGRVVHSPVPFSPDDHELRRAFDRGAAAKARLAALAQRRSLESGKLVAQIAMALALFLVLLVQGSATLAQGNNWSSLLIYVAALSFFSGSVARVVRVLVSVNRFYRPLAAHARLVETAERAGGPAEPADGFRCRLHARQLAREPAAALQMQPGDRVALVLPSEMTRFLMVPLAAALGATDKEGAARGMVFPWFASTELALGGGSLRENFGLPAGCSSDSLRAALAPLSAAETAISLPAELDRPLSKPERDALSPAAVFVLMTLSGVLNRRPILALDYLALSALDGAAQAWLFDQARQHIVLVAYRANAVAQVGSCEESAVIIAGSEEVVGWVSMESFDTGNAAVAQALARIAAEAAPAAAPAEAELDELES